MGPEHVPPKWASELYSKSLESKSCMSNRSKAGIIYKIVNIQKLYSKSLKITISAPERPRAAQSAPPERSRAPQSGPERPRAPQNVPERPRAPQSTPERPWAPQSVPNPFFKAIFEKHCILRIKMTLLGRFPRILRWILASLWPRNGPKMRQITENTVRYAFLT